MPFHDNPKNENIYSHSYSAGQVNYLRKEFVFSDESANFVQTVPSAAGLKAHISIRTARGDADRVYLNYNGADIEAHIQPPRGRFDYYTAVVDLEEEAGAYYFVIYKNDRVYFHNKKGTDAELDADYHFRLTPNFYVPDWAKGALMYQIYVDRFYNGDPSNDVVDNEYIYLSRPAHKVNDWHKDLSENDVCNFYGGDIRGIMDKMAYLNDLGVEVILLNPIFVSPSNHKYDIQDYDYVDPHFGVIAEDCGNPLTYDKFSNRFATKYLHRSTNMKNLEKSNELLVEFIELAHSYGIKVVLDGVFNHCGSFNKWLDKEGFYRRAGYKEHGAYFDKNSKYHDYFNWYDENWPGNDAYDCWWGHLNHPKLNYEHSENLYANMMEIAVKWVSPPFNADGWRLDVAADLGYSETFNHKFWKDFRRAVKKANPEAVILAEHYGDPSRWLMGDEWDTVMNYDAFMEPVTWFFTGMEKHSDEARPDLINNAMAFEERMRFHMAKFGRQSLLSALNQLSNHDHSRFLTRTNRTVGRLGTMGSAAAEKDINKSVMYEAVVVQMTWPGAPGIYYGDEAGLCGWTDPDSRRPYPWGNEDRLMIRFYKELGYLRKKYTCLKDGSMEYLYNAQGILSYGRWNKKEKIAVIVNNNDKEAVLNLPLWKLEAAEDSAFKRVMRTFNGSFDMAEHRYVVKDGHAEIQIGAFSAMILAQKDGAL